MRRHLFFTVMNMTINYDAYFIFKIYFTQVLGLFTIQKCTNYSIENVHIWNMCKYN